VRERDAGGVERARLVVPGSDRDLVELVAAPDAPPRPAAAAGLFHLALRVPDRGALGAALRRIRRAGASLSGASDHLVSEALYLRDPEGNGVEVYADRPRAEWPTTPAGRVSMDTLPLDLDALAADATDSPPVDEPAPGADGTARLPPGTDLGHVHLEATDLDRARAFYVDALGLTVRDEGYDGAAFLAAGDYHHHVGLNVWNDRSEPVGDSRGLVAFELRLPDAAALDALRAHLEVAGVPVETSGAGPAVHDPDGVAVRLRVAE
jgi:catechol 2,3-dioxygenase